MKVVWCVTGAGHMLEETVDHMLEMKQRDEITVVLSRAGCEVAAMYGLLEEIKSNFKDIILEKDRAESAPFVGRLWAGEYGKVYIAPCTANTAAKIVYGIADTLVSNIAAQAGKKKIPVVVLATDSERLQETRLPKGKAATLECRKTDLDNTAALSMMPGIKVVKRPEELL